MKEKEEREAVKVVWVGVGTCYLPPMWIDTHCHLPLEDFRAPDGSDERPQVLARARQAGVHQMIVVGSGGGWEDVCPALEYAQQDPHLYAAIGVHPNEAQVLTDNTPEAAFLWERLAQEIRHNPRVVAVGETGLDYYRTSATPAEQQQVFRRFLQLAKETNKPLSLHIREAHGDALACVREVSGVRGVVHCFTGTKAEAEAWVELGFSLSFSGIVTFPKAQSVQEACRFVPEERLLLETDSPYLAPVPFRGQRNEPAHVVHTGAFVATQRGLSVAQVAWQTTRNARCLFGLPTLSIETEKLPG